MHTYIMGYHLWYCMMKLAPSWPEMASSWPQVAGGPKRAPSILNDQIVRKGRKSQTNDWNSSACKHFCHMWSCMMGSNWLQVGPSWLQVALQVNPQVGRVSLRCNLVEAVLSCPKRPTPSSHWHAAQHGRIHWQILHRLSKVEKHNIYIYIIFFIHYNIYIYIYIIIIYITGLPIIPLKG